MTEADRNQPENTADNVGAWRRRLHRERDEEVMAYDRTRWGKPAKWNSAGRDKWWGATQHTMASAIEAARRHSATGSQILLRLVPVPPRRAPSPPPKRPRRGWLSLCARGGGSSSGRGSGSGSCRDDTRTWCVKEEPENVKPVVALPGFEVPPELHDELHDGDILVLSWALTESAVELERHSPGLM